MQWLCGQDDQDLECVVLSTHKSRDISPAIFNVRFAPTIITGGGNSSTEHCVHLCITQLVIMTGQDRTGRAAACCDWCVVLCCVVLNHPKGLVSG